MQQEQRELLQALYESHEGVLRRVAQSKRLPLGEIDDVVQDTFCLFIEAYGEKFALWNDRQIKAVLMKILYNRCADYYREKIRHPDTSFDEYVRRDEYQIITELITPDVGDHLMVKEDVRRIRECIQAMTPAMKDVVMLCMVEGRPIGEVCQILDITEAACRMRLLRARRHLARLAEESFWKKPGEQNRQKKPRISN